MKRSLLKVALIFATVLFLIIYYKWVNYPDKNLIHTDVGDIVVATVVSREFTGKDYKVVLKYRKYETTMIVPETSFTHFQTGANVYMILNNDNLKRASLNTIKKHTTKK